MAEPGRLLAGARAAREALARVARRMEGAGDAPTFEGFVAVTSPPMTAAIHLMTGALAAAVGWRWPLIGLAILALGLRSALAELRGGRPWLRRLLPRGASYNLLARRPPLRERRGALVLAIHLDRPRQGLTVSRRAVWAAAFATGVMVLGLLGRAAGLVWPMLLGAQAAAGIALGLGALVALFHHRLPARGGAALEVDALFEAAGRLAERPLEHLELVILVAGCGAAHATGATALIRQHRHEWSAEDTAFVFIDRLGRGPLVYATGEQVWEPAAYRPTLPAVVERLARRRAWRDVAARTIPRITGALHVTRAGFRAVTLTSDPAGEPRHDDPDPARRCGALAAELAWRYDADLGDPLEAAPLPGGPPLAGDEP